MKPDFSNLSATTAPMVARYYESGGQPYDEMFSEALEHFVEPLLLAEHEMDRIFAILSGKRGRAPKETSTRDQLANLIAGLNRHDIPKPFISALAERIKSGKRFTEDHYGKRFQTHHNKRVRNTLIYFLYRQRNIQDGKNFLLHPDFGHLDCPKTECTRSERAAFMTHTVIDKHLGMFAPSVRTILNIITKNN